MPESSMEAEDAGYDALQMGLTCPPETIKRSEPLLFKTNLVLPETGGSFPCAVHTIVLLGMVVSQIPTAKPVPSG